MSRSIEPDLSRNDAGFTLIEALVALAVVATSLGAIGSLVATNLRATESLDQRLALIETSRTILTALPSREQLEPGDSSGEIADYRWRLDIMPFVADFVDPSQRSPWVPEAIVLRVQSPTGELLRIDTVRLRHSQDRDR